MVRNLYVFRHGESTFNAAGITQGHDNRPKLTEKGKGQAKVVGEKLKDRNIKLIFSSPLTRARETAEIANRDINAEIIFDDRFIEVDAGAAAGFTKEDNIKNFPEISLKWKERGEGQDMDIRFPGGESKREVLNRVKKGILDIFDKYPEEAIAISGHGIIVGSVLAGFCNEYGYIPNAAIAHLQFDDGEWTFAGFI